MALRNTSDEYGTLAKALHWLVAIGVFALIWLGLQQSGMDRGPERQEIRDLHGSIAIVVFVLMSIRLVWRFLNEVPAHPTGTPAWQRAAAGIVHWGLYLTVFVQITAGAMTVATGGRALDFFGLARPSIGGAVAVEVLIVLLLAVHVIAALYHQFIAKDGVLRRMTVGSKVD